MPWAWRGPPPLRDAKYSPLQKLFHRLVAVLVLAIVATGLLMLSKIDTPFWRRNPYWLADTQWGMVYAIHGLLRDGHDHPDHGACLFRAATGEAVDDPLDVPRLDLARGLSGASRSAAMVGAGYGQHITRGQSAILLVSDHT